MPAEGPSRTPPTGAVPHHKPRGIVSFEKLDFNNPGMVCKELLLFLDRQIVKEWRPSNSPYERLPAKLRRQVYRIGFQYLRSDTVSLMLSYIAGHNGRTERKDANVFTGLLRIACAGQTMPSFSNANIKKYASMMQLAYSWDVHWQYLDHFQCQIGAFENSAESRANLNPHKWVLGITNRSQESILVNNSSGTVKGDL
jgi:hypothetical protein